MNKEQSEGYSAFQSGKRLRDNPYPKGSAESEDWDDGFMCADDETLEDVYYGDYRLSDYKGREDVFDWYGECDDL